MSAQRQLQEAPDLRAVPPVRSDTAPDFAVTLEESAERMAQLRRFKAEQMTVGVHYGNMPGTPRPMLFKPGAEALLSVYGFSARVGVTARVEKWDATPPFCSYEVLVTIYNRRTGCIEAESIGFCNSKERKYKSQDAANVANTILKMAKKRALVDATLQATRSSALFMSEDGDDIEAPNNQSQQQRSAQQRSAQQGQPQQARRQQAPQQTEAPRLLATREQLDRCERSRKRAVELGYRVDGKLPRPIADGALAQEAGEKCARWESYIKAQTAAPAEHLEPQIEAPAEKRGPRYAIPEHLKSSPAQNCKSCGASIYWIKSPDTGATIPVNADGYSHFTTCPDAAQHSKKNAAPVDQPLWDGDNETPSAARNAKVAAESAYAAAAPKNATPAPQIGRAPLSPMQKRLWAVIQGAGLPQAKEGAQRDERLYNANQTLLDHHLDVVESFSQLSDEAARCLISALEAGILTWGQIENEVAA